jgi:hypothetical protein
MPKLINRFPSVYQKENEAFAPNCSRSEHDIRVSVEDRAEQVGDLRRVVLEVGVLHPEDVTASEAESLAKR